jgi:hypothetical protein
VATGGLAPDETAGTGFAPSEPLRNETVSARDSEIRLGCLRAAIELRSAGNAPGDLLVTAAAFYEFVTGPRDDLRERDASPI